MSDGERPPALDGARPIPTYRGHPAPLPSDLIGVAPDGSPATVEVLVPGRFSLLLFLSESCDGCAEFWPAAAQPPAAGLATDEQVAVVVRTVGERAAAAAAAGAVVVCDPAAFSRYGVSAPPFFSLVDGTAATVVTEGLAWGAAQVGALVGAARAGRPVIESPRLRPGGAP